MVTKEDKLKREKQRALRVWVGFWAFTVLLLAAGVFAIVVRICGE